MCDILLIFERIYENKIFLSFSCKVLKKNACDCPNFGINDNTLVKTNS